MDERLSTKPTVGCLKEALGESLEHLKKEFEGLKDFVAEIAPEGISASAPLTKDDLDDLLTVTLDIHDAANDIAFEASKIKEKLRDFGW